MCEHKVLRKTGEYETVETDWIRFILTLSFWNCEIVTKHVEYRCPACHEYIKLSQKIKKQKEDPGLF